MIEAIWRIEKTKYAAAAREGEGARLTGGRWTSPGRRAIYCAQHLSLAILEVLVHAPDSTQRLAERVYFRIRLDTSLTETVRTRDLPGDFSPRTPYDITRALGDEWLRQNRTPVLSVPSAVVPTEHNYILNPDHTHFGKLTWEPQKTIRLDDRLWIVAL